MKLQDMLLTENATVKQAIQRLESVRCKVVYIVRGRKLLASISDGDIRRFTLKDGNIRINISSVANYSPYVLKDSEKERWEMVFQETELYSIPVVNLNGEIIGVILRNGVIIRDQKIIDIPVVMMAGGRGTRLHPYTKILPKALIPIGDIPISEHIFNRFFKAGCSKFFMLLNHKSAMIRSYFETIKKPYSLQYVEEIEPLGTGGGLSLLKNQVTCDFFLTNCDMLIDADYAEIYDIHNKKENFITMVLAEYREQIPYGVVSTDQECNYENITEKPTLYYLINTGVYIVSAELIKELDENIPVDFPNLIERYRKKGKKIGCYVVKESAYMDMGQFEELEKMKEKLNV